jgi:hypothetical protein
MRDVVYLAITVGFFALAALFVVGCARIVGPDDASLGRGEQGNDGEGADRAAGPVAVPG